MTTRRWFALAVVLIAFQFVGLVALGLYNYQVEESVVHLHERIPPSGLAAFDHEHEEIKQLNDRVHDYGLRSECDSITNLNAIYKAHHFDPPSELVRSVTICAGLREASLAFRVVGR